MTRPAVIIGLGGTGQWVTTYVKKELLEDNGGNWPSNVRLLSFDTWSNQNVSNNTADLQNVVSIGNTSLDLNTEFIPLSGNVFNKAQQVVNNQAPYIGKRISDLGDAYSWFDARYFIDHLSSATWNLNVGAGAIRQFGRMAFFNHATVIQQHLTNAFNAVRPAGGNQQAANGAAVPKADAVQILIVSSFAGGTGAGMFIDMAVMARQLATQIFGVNGAFMRGIFVFPGTFQKQNQQEANEMKARAYAAWRELARFMNLGPVFGAHRVMYDGVTSVDVSSKPFDQVFLVDSDRARNSFTNVRPENGVFPSIANFISTTLDDEAGLDLGAAVNAISGGVQGQLGFSTFGAYSVQLPISHAVREYALQLERDMLLRWLAPQFGTVDGHPAVTGLQANQNAEQLGKEGDKEVQSFMTLPVHELKAVINRSDAGIPNPSLEYQNSPFLAKVNTYYDHYTTGMEKGQVEKDAQGGFCPAGDDEKIDPNSWLGTILLPGDFARTPIPDGTGRPIPVNDGQIKAEIAAKVRGKVQTSRDTGNDPTSGEADRIALDVEGPNGFIKNHYGDTKGSRGSFDSELDTLVKFNSLRFRQILSVAMMNILNGTVQGLGEGFTGRLGYAEAFLKKQREIFEWFVTQHLVDVKTARAKLDQIGAVQSILQASRDEMNRWAGRKCIFFFAHPRGHYKQEDYLEDAQNLCEVLKDDKVIAAADKIATACKDAIIQAEEQVASWKNVFVMGTDSLYAQALAQYTQVAADLDNQAAANQAQSFKKLRNYPADYTQNADVINRIDDQLKQIRWMIPSEGNFKINCEINQGGSFTQLVPSKDDKGFNQSVLAELGRVAWQGFGSQQSILEQLSIPGNANYIPGDQLGNKMIELSDPMYLSAVVGAGVKSAMRRASNVATPNFNPAVYLAAVDAQSDQFAPPLSGQNHYHKSNSNNPHKISMLQWVDRLAPRNFTAYAGLEKEYKQLIQGGNSIETASRLHIFPAEANAAFYEHHLPLWMGKQVREFSPRVVLTLTEVEKVRWFFQCYALGYILHGSYVGGPIGRWWRLVIPGARGQDVCFFSSTDNAEPDPFVLISQFCKGLDVMTQTPVVWETPGEVGNILDVRTTVENALISRKNEIRGLIDAQVSNEKGALPAVDYRIGNNMVLDETYRLIPYFEDHSLQLYNDYITTHPQTQAANPGWSWLGAQDYSDLATLGRMMYIETLLIKRLLKVDDLKDPNLAGYFRGERLR